MLLTIPKLKPKSLIDKKRIGDYHHNTYIENTTSITNTSI